MRLKRTLAFLGAVLLCVGVFLPVVSRAALSLSPDQAVRLGEAFKGAAAWETRATMSLLGVAGYARRVDTGCWEALVLVLLAVVCVSALLLRWRWTCRSAAGLSLAFVGESWLNVLSGRRGLSRDLPWLAESLQLRWGWWILLAGAILLVVAAALPGRKEEPPEEPPDGNSAATQRMVRYQMGEGMIPRATD